VRAAVEANFSLVEKFRPSSAATLGSSTSVKTYQIVLLEPARWPLYNGIVMVPCAASTVPEFNNWTGPTRLWFTLEGEGPK
jgi:hypothetical protein